ncbi:MAG: hypothetical protein CMO41_01725 [Verrucomicrobiales bacterium]|nr:hypothetical protein [Verrucomicrobiales bacterium]
MNEHNMRKPWLLILILCGSLLPTAAMSSASEEVTYTLSGHVYTSTGEPAGSTYVRIDAMESVLSSDGTYSFPGITPGEHTARAYFMNDGHTVAYRTIFIDGDTTLDWYEGHNWITVDALDANGDLLDQSESVSVSLLERNESQDFNNGRAEFGPYLTGDYHTVSTSLSGSASEQLVVCLRLEPGSAATPRVNHLQFKEGTNSVFGFLSDASGSPAREVEVSSGDVQATTNDQGFYLLNGLPLNAEVELTFSQSGQSIASNLSVLVDYGANWLNHTTSIALELPRNATFVESAISVPFGPVNIGWTIGAYTDYVELFVGEISQAGLIYKGTSTSFEYTPTAAGTSEFYLVSYNTNGSNPSAPSLLVLFLPTESDDGSWTSGMSWDYSLVHTPEYRSNRTLTAIGTEDITDAFGRVRSTYLLRIMDDQYEEGEQAFRWVDTETYLPVKTYWVDAPSSSSYFQEGSLGWMFTDGANPTGLFGEVPTSHLHFNRTNIIGVPGHPNGYDDTLNSVLIEHNVSVSTAAGVFSCTYIAIQDDDDGVLSWELWYNATVQNYVKIIDRLPGSHSDSVVHELTGYDRPQTPEFLTETTVQTEKTFEIQWSEFVGAEAYQLLENGVEVYRGVETGFELRNRENGVYRYQVNAIMPLDYLLLGSTLDVEVSFLPPLPVLTASASFIQPSEKALLSWDYAFEAESYTVTMQTPDGDVVEVYKGSSTFVEVGDLEPGLHRFRLTATVDGATSEPSDSIFVTVEDPSSAGSEGAMPSLSFLSLAFVMFTAVLLLEIRRDET